MPESPLPTLQPVRGTHDILPEQMRRHRHVTDTAQAVTARWGYGEIATPIFEFTEVFQRTLGETTDIVTKEMYTFQKGDESLTLRPENTAGVARAVISGGLRQMFPLKVFYRGPMFRHERPQKGRQRQFHQIGVEVFGIPGPEADVEVVALGHHILETLGIAAKVELQLNSLGDTESRTAYRALLVEYFRGHRDRLSEESRARLERNPLRILDSKDGGDRAVIADAPRLIDHLNPASAAFFAKVKDGLDALGIAYTLNPRLVRGLDYYCHTAFEFVTDALGAQGTVMGGGRYDGLVSTMGGPETPGVGWAAGVERMEMLIAEPPAAPRPVAVAPVETANEAEAARLAYRLRRAGYAVEYALSGNLRKRLRNANRVQARHAVLIGGEEWQRGTVVLRDLDSGSQEEVALDRLEAVLGPV